MIVETWRADTYPPVGPPLCGRYVRWHRDAGFEWIETNTSGKNGWKWDVRRGTCDAVDLPSEVASAAKGRHASGVWPFYVEWPL
jgi:hypothetical protein